MEYCFTIYFLIIKGKGRIFHGKGTLHFTKSSSPPHGYDYGMKSGKCIKMSDRTIKTIEGHFDQGVLDGGEAEVTYFDKTMVKVNVQKGYFHGFARKYETVKDKETNVEKHEKELYAVTNYKNGVQFGPEWKLKENGVQVLLPDDLKNKKTLAFVTIGNETKHYSGILEEEDMMVKVQEARLVGVKEENCIKIPEIETFGEVFDYDLQVRSKMKATVAKIVRFFEIVTDEKLRLDNHFKLSETDYDPKSAKPLIKILKYESNHYSILLNEEPSRANYEGTKDKDDMPNGSGIIKILTDMKRKDFLKRARGNVTENENKEETESAKEYMESYVPVDMIPRMLTPKQVVSIKGRFQNGALQGFITVEYGDGSAVEGFVVDGSWHGIVRHLAPPFKHGRRKRYVRRQIENVIISAGTMGKDEPVAEVVFVGKYKNGLIDGPGWKFLVGGTYLFGHFKKTSTFTTNHGAFINQDLESCYFGRFVDSKMMSGQLAQVIGEESMDDMKVPLFSEPSGTVYRYGIEEGANTLTDPLVTDITEDTWVYVKKSNISGEGLFAKQDVPGNTVVAYFGGIQVSMAEWNKTKTLDPNYWMKTESGRIIYLPEEIGKSTDKYRATLAHKINHSFQNWNCMFHPLDHPRFGLIPAARTTEPILKDTELVCLYEMKYDEGAPWYQELWRQEIDSDFIYGPFGHRGTKKNQSEPIQPWLDNGTIYNDFYKHAVEVLKLEPVT